MTQRDHDGRRRSGVWLPDECWDWLDRTAQRDGASRSDLVEGLVLLAMDEEAACIDAMRPGLGIYASWEEQRAAYAGVHKGGHSCPQGPPT